ncbi:MAG: hypothetical protein ACK5B9_05230 [Flavobacteriia bacterium]|jgi:hypothetical protein
MAKQLKIYDVRFEKTYIITSITDTRVNLDSPGNKFTSSTGRSSSKFYIGIKKFEKLINNGTWILLN